jgi:hypothetical protein
MNTIISPANPFAWKPNFAGSQAVVGGDEVGDGVGTGVGLAVGDGVGVGAAVGDSAGVSTAAAVVVGSLALPVVDGRGSPSDPHPATRVTAR